MSTSFSALGDPVFDSLRRDVLVGLEHASDDAHDEIEFEPVGNGEYYMAFDAPGVTEAVAVHLQQARRDYDVRFAAETALTVGVPVAPNGDHEFPRRF